MLSCCAGDGAAEAPFVESAAGFSSLVLSLPCTDDAFGVLPDSWSSTIIIASDSLAEF